MTELNIITNNVKSQLYALYSYIKESLTKLELEELNKDNNFELSCSMDINMIINYIKNFINYIIKEKKNNNYNTVNHKQLENYIIKLENDIRILMKKLFQNKIKKESLEMKIRAYIQMEEDYEELKEKVKYEDGKFLNNDRKDNEIIILRKENSNLKKEINKLKEENKEIRKLENKNKELDKKYNDNEEIIKKLKNKVNQLNNKIIEMKKELNNTKNNILCNINSKKDNEKQLKLININDNENKDKIVENKSNINNKNKMNIQFGMTNYKLPSNFFNYESNKNNHNYSNKNIDADKYIVSLYNKIYNNSHKSIIGKDININNKKTKNSPKSNIPKEKVKFEIMDNYLSGNNNNKYIKHIKSRSLNKIYRNLSVFQLVNGNNSINKRTIYRESKSPYENSALNIFGINKNTYI